MSTGRDAGSFHDPGRIIHFKNSIKSTASNQVLHGHFILLTLKGRKLKLSATGPDCQVMVVAQIDAFNLCRRM